MQQWDGTNLGPVLEHPRGMSDHEYKYHSYADQILNERNLYWVERAAATDATNKDLEEHNTVRRMLTRVLRDGYPSYRENTIKQLPAVNARSSREDLTNDLRDQVDNPLNPLKEFIKLNEIDISKLSPEEFLTLAREHHRLRQKRKYMGSSLKRATGLVNDLSDLERRDKGMDDFQAHDEDARPLNREYDYKVADLLDTVWSLIENQRIPGEPKEAGVNHPDLEALRHLWQNENTLTANEMRALGLDLAMNVMKRIIAGLRQSAQDISDFEQKIRSGDISSALKPLEIEALNEYRRSI